MRNFLILVNSYKDSELQLTKTIINKIESLGGKARYILDTDTDDLIQKIGDRYLKSLDCVIVLGGDGTFLQASNALREFEVPMIGVNLGTLGFLTEVETSQIDQMLKRLFEDNYDMEERMHIYGEVLRDGEIIGCGHALNDIVITRSGSCRVVCFKIYVNDELLDVYEADGIIISTPTGSTAYNLSAGGPIVSPKTKLIIVTPIAPHSLTSKSVVFSMKDEIKIEVLNKRVGRIDEAATFFDGTEGVILTTGDVVVVKKAEEETRLVKLQNVSFYEVLRNKIGS